MSVRKKSHLSTNKQTVESGARKFQMYKLAS